MKRTHRLGRRSLALALICCAALGFAASVGASPTPRAAHAPGSLQAAFESAAREFGVPASLLLGVSYNLSRWESHGGAPSASGGYGPMHLTHVDSLPSMDGKGDGVARPRRDTRGVAALHTLDAAAALLGVPASTLRRDPAQNIRGGAALLAQYARAPDGSLPAGLANWYAAVMRYSQAAEPRAAARFADGVYATINAGAARTTGDGQSLALAATSVAASRPAEVAALANAAAPECPPDAPAGCEFIPAAYTLNDPNNLANYGNYDLANRPADGLDVRYIVIHDAEGSYEGTVAHFQNPLAGVSAHYVIDSLNATASLQGHIAQMIETKNVGWHAGNWYVNGHAIGIEHEGFAIDGATWYSEAMYQASAALVRYLAARYAIPLDRAHIIGHDDIPGPLGSYQAGMHWDPGPFWDWTHYMDLIGASAGATDTGAINRIVTLRIDPAANVQTVKDCEGNGALSTRGTNFVYLRTSPSDSAPYVSNPYFTSDPLCANNWANKAPAGQSFYRFATSGDWDGIYFGGGQAWFKNPGHALTRLSSGKLVQPKGRSSISVYGRAYPERSAYPRGITAQTVEALRSYKFPAGQRYVAFGPYTSAYYYAPVYITDLAGSSNRVIKGATQYYQIFYNHRFVFVNAADVTVANQP